MSTQDESTSRHVRGSALFLGGRFIGIGIDFVIHVLLIRYLTQTDFGAFAFGLAAAELGSSLAVFGLDKTVGRFIPIYEEAQEYSKVFGALILMAVTVTALGLSVALATIALALGVGGQIGISDESLRLMPLLALMAPILALRAFGTSALAIFAKPMAILVRRYLVIPGLQLAAVAVVAVTGGDVVLIGATFVVVGVIGTAVDIVLLWSAMHRRGLLAHLRPREMAFPVRQIMGFSAPLVFSDMALIVRSSAVVVIIELLRGTTQVALFRAATPLARQNSVVQQSFRILFMPLASRLYARRDREGVNELYWTSAIWICVLSFPVFLVTFALAEPLIVFIAGERYRESGLILAALSLGHFFNAALGFNSLLLRVYGKVRYLLMIDLLATVTGLAATFILVDAYGALGGAVAVAATLVLQNVGYHLGLRLGTDVDLFQWRYLRVYAAMAVGAAGMLAVQELLALPLWFGIIAAGVIALAVALVARETLDPVSMFPELNRVPLVGRLLGRSKTAK